jgi:hypothetical protein
VSTRLKSLIGWLLLGWCLLVGAVVWVSRKTEKVDAVLVASAYLTILIYGVFFRPKEELRKRRLEYFGFAIMLVFWLFLTFALFAK